MFTCACLGERQALAQTKKLRAQTEQQRLGRTRS